MSQADGEYIPKQAVLESIDKWYEDKADIEDLIVKITYMPSVDIPPEHDGCKDCKYETYPDYYYPCCECKQNYMDEWKAMPSAEPYKGMTNGEVIKAMFGDDKVSEFMGYARVMARVGNWFNDGVVAEFDKDWWNSPYEPQESEEV